jgi:hypothetical protein
MKKGNWKKYAIEFLSIFIAVTFAFALENWNENRRDGNAESKIITEIHNGLKKDLDDIRINMIGHKDGIRACQFWRDITEDREVSPDSIMHHYLNLTRDFISIQNVSGYETLKSRGLELVKDDSLRSSIIALYEYDYNTLRKFEEEYNEMQFQENYFKEINAYLAPNFIFDEKGNMVGIDLPLKLSESEKNILLSYLWKIQLNRNFILYFYSNIENKVNEVVARIERNQP